MNRFTQRQLIEGVVGKIEVAIDIPEAVREDHTLSRGVALVAHPHPLFGGTMDNKVVQTLAKTLLQLGYVVFRCNFRGVGQTQGVHDDGIGETDDLLKVLQFMKESTFYQGKPMVLAGFSFGTFVLSRVMTQLQNLEQEVERVIFVGTATSRWKVENVPENTLAIHGEQDDTVPIESVYRWAEPQELPIVVVPGAEHFFHSKLHILKKIIIRAWKGA